jgi:hypothetical protein
LDRLIADNNTGLKQDTQDYLTCLELLTRHWSLLKESKYKYRNTFYGTHNEAISQFIPRTLRQIFSLQSLLTSLSKPFGTTTSKDKISRAGREYFHSACKLNLRFNELLNMVQINF